MGGLFYLLKKLKKICAIMLILCLFPYIVTVFVNGKSNEAGKYTELEEYCLSVLSKEVSSEYEEEMLKVQAVIVRTTIYQNINEINWSELETIKLEKGWEQRLRKAWESTEGQVLMYDGNLALLPFHYLSNGKTRSGTEVLQSEAYPYLQIRECLKDLEAPEQLGTQMLELTNAEILATDHAGYVTKVKVGEETLTGESFRDKYQLASSAFELQSFETKTCVITKGVGHGLGLSQYTANEMAKEGKTYQEILQFFYEGTEMREVAEVLIKEE